MPSLSSSSSRVRGIGSIVVARGPRWVYKVSLLLQRQVSCRNAEVSPLIQSREGERIAIVPQRGQAGNVCDIETENHRNSRRVTVSRDGIESATRKSEVNCSGFFQIHF